MPAARRSMRRTSRRTARRTSRRVNRRQNMFNAATAAPSGPAPAQSPPPATDAAAGDPYEKLRKLGELHAQGILTDEEFAAEKAKVLGN